MKLFEKKMFFKDGEKILKAVKYKQHIICNGTMIQITGNFYLEIMETKMQQNSFKVMREK